MSKNALSPLEYEIATKHMKDRNLDFLVHSIGCKVQITSRNHRKITGILYSVDTHPKNNNNIPSIVIKFPTTEKITFDDELLTIESNDIADIQFFDVDLSNDDKLPEKENKISIKTKEFTKTEQKKPKQESPSFVASPATNNVTQLKNTNPNSATPAKTQLTTSSNSNLASVPTASKMKIDSAISFKANQSQQPRELQRWQPDEKDSSKLMSLDDDSSNNKPWNQFETNRSKFGVDANFDEYAYTTKLNTNGPNFNERLKFANKMADEINNSTSSHHHINEERGITTNTDLDDEDKYSGVISGNSDSEKKLLNMIKTNSNSNKEIRTFKDDQYVPPQHRAAKFHNDAAVISSSSVKKPTISKSESVKQEVKVTPKSPPTTTSPLPTAKSSESSPTAPTAATGTSVKLPEKPQSVSTSSSSLSTSSSSTKEIPKKPQSTLPPATAGVPKKPLVSNNSVPSAKPPTQRNGRSSFSSSNSSASSASHQNQQPQQIHQSKMVNSSQPKQRSPQANKQHLNLNRNPYNTHHQPQFPNQFQQHQWQQQSAYPNQQPMNIPIQPYQPMGILPQQQQHQQISHPHPHPHAPPPPPAPQQRAHSKKNGFVLSGSTEKKSRSILNGNFNILLSAKKEFLANNESIKNEDECPFIIPMIQSFRWSPAWPNTVNESYSELFTKLNEEYKVMIKQQQHNQQQQSMMVMSQMAYHNNPYYYGNAPPVIYVDPRFVHYQNQFQ